MRIHRSPETVIQAIDRDRRERTSASWDTVRYAFRGQPALSESPAPDAFPVLLVSRETAHIPLAIDWQKRVREARKVTREVLDNFWGDIEYNASAPFLQLMDAGGYNESARKNRERIASGR